MSTIEKAAARLAELSKRTERDRADDERRPDAIGSVKNLDETGADSEPAAIERLDAHAHGRRHAAKLQESRRDLKLFCEIDLDQLEARGYLRPGEGRSQLAREMRRIKRPLLLKIDRQQALMEKEPDVDHGNPANLIMITSALPGEGKTFVSINLVMSLAAELDKRVLLVDADVLKGDVSEQLGILTERGLADLLHENNYLHEDGVLTSNIERLSILPAGRNTDHVDELFASDMMALVVRELAEADPDRVVIFDAPPLLPTTEAAVLSRYMGQVVVVVGANETPQAAVAEAVAQLEDRDAISLVLNKTTGRDSAGYGYGYGYGYGSEERAAAAYGKDSKVS